jgi:2,5-diamino-6-(ribosylamino)-4(3H)-pyrimidinone 5'-phosphate reductase
MAPSIDGRIVTARWKLASSVHAEYERTGETFGADAWMVGRITMAPFAGRARIPARRGKPPIARTDFIATTDAASYAIALDPSGKLTWTSNAIDGEHVIAVVTEQVSDDYLAFLQSKRVSYLFGGRSDVDLKMVLRKLAKAFGIRKLLVEGGGKINGSFLAANLVDELSVLLLPIVDGAIGAPSLFDATEGRGPIRHFRLVAIEKRKSDLVWLRYRMARSAARRR